VSIRSDSQAALKALHSARTKSRLVQQCQKASNDISTRRTVGLYWLPGHGGARANQIADELARGGSAPMFVGPEPA
jgi:ribonuclease HI